MKTFLPLALTLLAVAANAAPAAQIGPLFGTTTTTTDSSVTTSEHTLSVGSHPVPLSHGIKTRSAQNPSDDDNSSTEDDKTEAPVTVPAFHANRPFAPVSLSNGAPNSRPVRETDDTTTTTTTTFPTTSDRSAFSAHLSPVGLANSESRPVRQLTSSTTEVNTTTESKDVPRFHARVPVKTSQD